MSRIKECFTSRFTKGHIVNFDYKQLEVVALAVLSQDKTLMSDLRSGEDQHKKYAIKVFGRSNDQLRTYIKRMTFMLQYGATAAGMARSLGLSKAVTGKFIDEYFTRYPQVKLWQEKQLSEVQTNSIPDPELSDASAFPLSSSIIQSVTGRLYKYNQEVSNVKDWKTGLTSAKGTYKPTQIKNYPVQGIATGDLVPLMCGLVNKFILTNEINGVLLVNTVHDSIMLDVDLATLGAEEFRSHMRSIKVVLESAPQAMKDFYGVDWNLPTPVDSEYGISWGELHPLIL